MGSVTVKAAGQENTATAPAAQRRACQRTAVFAVAGENASVASASALFMGRLEKSVKDVRHAETPAALQSEYNSTCCSSHCVRI